jgi:hypothetical protein
MYEVFIRNWWRWETTPEGKQKVPHPTARKTHYVTVWTEEEAREACQRYNSTHNEGALSRKAEYTKIR